MFNEQQLNAIIKLTEAHSQSELIRAFLNNMQELKLADRAQFFEIYNDQRDREFDGRNINNALIRDPVDPSFVAIPVSDNDDYVKATEKLEIIRVDSDNGEYGDYVIPVTGHFHAVGLLVVKHTLSSHENWEFICALVDIFGNLLSLVGKKERDALTGLLNRLVFEERAHEILHYTMSPDRRIDNPHSRICFAMIDLDKFKLVNDNYGHLYGDEVLVHFSQILTRSFRYFDLICRYGGEEFTVVLRGAGLKQALEILDRFREAVQNYNFPQVGPQTASIGVVEIKPGEIMTTIIDKADKALYYSKMHGRNQVNAYDLLVDEGKLPPHEAGEGDVELF